MGWHEPDSASCVECGALMIASSHLTRFGEVEVCEDCSAGIEPLPVGYVHCAHDPCFAILVGTEGDLCDDCREADPEHDHDECENCDNDSEAKTYGDEL